MAMKKGGLGKGLDVLFAQNTVEEEATPITLPLTDIIPNKDQPRKQFNEEALGELADSIAQHGVIQPLLVRPMPDGTYQLVAGERRFRAASMAGLTQVPVVIRSMEEREAAEVAMIENLQREDLNPMEEALGYQTLMKNYGMTQEQTAQVVNKSRPAVANALRLLHLSAPVQQLVADGSLSAGHARTLVPVEDADKQLRLAKDTVDNAYSVRQLEVMVKKANKPQSEPKKPVKKPHPFYGEVELALRESLGRQVKIVASAKGGTLQIEFFDEADLQALANSLAKE